MENKVTGEYVLTLKNIYRMLTKFDFMGHSYPPLPPTGMHGQTLVRFWRELFARALPEGFDLSLFDSENGRSRSLTKLLNHSGTGKLADKWFGELSELNGEELLLNLTQAWMDTLTGYDYNSDTLTVRLNRYLEALLCAGELEKAENEQLFRNLQTSLVSSREATALFRHALALGLLSIYALYSNRLKDIMLDKIRMTADLGISELYLRGLHSTDARIISKRDCLLCIQPLEKGRYFGNQEALDQMAEVLVNGSGKLLITGLGGIGKTEFARQLLQKLKAMRIYKRIAFVQYETDLTISFLLAFEALNQVSATQRAEKAREILEKADEGRTLLLIDNLDNSPADDKDINKLCTFGCDIVITTRLTELDGFTSFKLNGLSTVDAVSLFMSIAPDASKQFEAVQGICNLVYGHPLAIGLFANLCKMRFWPAERLLDRLKQSGIKGLTFIRQAVSVSIPNVLSETFDMSHISDQQNKLLRLMSILPLVYRLPDQLFVYAQDVFSNADDLTDACCILSDLGWLMRSNEGFAIHPLIAQMIRLRKFGTDEFPVLWNRICQSGLDQTNIRELISVVLSLPTLRLENIRAAILLEKRIAFIPYLHLPDTLYELTENFLKNEAHETCDDADFLVALCYRDLVVKGNIEAFTQRLTSLISDHHLLLSMHDKAPVYSLLENGAYIPDTQFRKLISEAFTVIRPSEDNTDRLISHLISLGEYQRVALNKAQLALDSLNQAEQLLQSQNESGTQRCANLYYRKACCLLDLSQNARAADCLGACIEIMSELGNRDDSVNMMSTRNTYALALMRSGDSHKAMEQFQMLDRIYKEQKRDNQTPYASLQNNIAMLMYDMGMYKEAESCIKTALRIDQMHEQSQNIPVHQRNAAQILTRLNRPEEAMAYAEQAIHSHEKYYGNDSYKTCYARAIYALALAHNGRAEEAMEAINSALPVLIKELGEEHLFTKSAMECRAEIEALMKK